MNTKSIWAIFAALIINCAFSTATLATTVYEYKGNPFELFQDPVGALPSTLTALSGTMTLSIDLAPNLPLTSVYFDVLNFSFTDGATVLTKSSPEIKWNIWVSTDENSNIVDWDLNIFHYPAFAGDVSFTSYTALARGSVLDGTAYAVDDSGGTTTLANVKDNPGIWTTRVIPVPAAVWLFGSGLIGLIGVARRKKG